MNTQTKVQRFPRIILALLLMVGGFLMSSVPAHADDTVKSVVAIAQNDANIQGIVSISNDSLKKRSINILEYDAKAGTVSFDYATYNQRHCSKRPRNPPQSKALQLHQATRHEDHEEHRHC